MPFETDWNAELPRMLERQEPENLRLDYKERRRCFRLEKAGEELTARSEPRTSARMSRRSSTRREVC